MKAEGNSSSIHSFLHPFMYPADVLEPPGRHRRYSAGSDEDNIVVEVPWSGGQGRVSEGHSACGRDL